MNTIWAEFSLESLGDVVTAAIGSVMWIVWCFTGAGRL